VHSYIHSKRELDSLDLEWKAKTSEAGHFWLIARTPGCGYIHGDDNEAFSSSPALLDPLALCDLDRRIHHCRLVVIQFFTSSPSSQHESSCIR